MLLKKYANASARSSVLGDDIHLNYKSTLETVTLISKSLTTIKLSSG
jgi:hypothetical protein